MAVSPILSVSKATIAVVSGTIILVAKTIDYFRGESEKTTIEKTKEIVVDTGKAVINESINTTSNVINEVKDTIVSKETSDNILNFFTQAMEILYQLPEIIKIIFKNIINFFLIFCVLIIVGRFDWLLDDVYTLSAVSFGIVYIVKK